MRSTTGLGRGLPVLSGLIAALALTSPLSQVAAEPAPARAEPTVEVTPDGHGASGLVRASVDIDAPPATVWRMLLDCSAATRLMVNLKTCRVVDHDPAGHWDVREQITRGSLLPGIRTVVHADYDEPTVIKFHRVDGDLKVLEGEWRLAPIDGGTETHLTYESRVAAPYAAPGFMVRSVLRHDMPVTLTNLRNACEQQVGTERLASAKPLAH